MTASEILRAAAALNLSKSEEYGNAPNRFGEVMSAFFPSGIHIEGIADFNRFQIFVQMVVKLTRYRENWVGGGHEDSLRDLAVYAAMLQAYDSERRQR